MTRKEVTEQYLVDDEQGYIRSPGKFQSEPVYAPHFWSAGLEGAADFDEDGVYGFEVTDEDRLEFPELQGVNVVLLEETEQGFVNCETAESLPESGEFTDESEEEF